MVAFFWGNVCDACASLLAPLEDVWEMTGPIQQFEASAATIIGSLGLHFLAANPKLASVSIHHRPINATVTSNRSVSFAELCRDKCAHDGIIE